MSEEKRQGTLLYRLEQHLMNCLYWCHIVFRKNLFSVQDTRSREPLGLKISEKGRNPPDFRFGEIPMDRGPQRLQSGVTESAHN